MYVINYNIKKMCYTKERDLYAKSYMVNLRRKKIVALLLNYSYLKNKSI